MTSNNEGLRALFTLPPISTSANTALTIPTMPPQETVTGDHEVDAVLWLQRVVGTGNQALIDKAMQAVKHIKTPMEQLGKRYSQLLATAGHHPLQVVFATFNFGDLEELARRAVDKATRRHDALARFGCAEQLAAETPAEKACKKALRGLKRTESWLNYDAAEAAKRFSACPDLVPATIDDCLYARAYWDRLYLLRSAVLDYGDSQPTSYAHERYCYAMLADIPPRSMDEAVAAFEHLDADSGADWERVQPIIRNLIASGWNAQAGAEQ